LNILIAKYSIWYVRRILFSPNQLEQSTLLDNLSKLQKLQVFNFKETNSSSAKTDG